MTPEGSQTSGFPCPVYQNEVDLKLPHDRCRTGRLFTNMAGVRKHMLHDTREYPRHLPFLQQCMICKHDFIDEVVYSEKHGKICTKGHRTVLKGSAAKEHYEAFKAMTLDHLAGKSVTSTGKCIHTQAGQAYRIPRALLILSSCTYYWYTTSYND
jgi:hypothetical protein